MRYRKQTQSGDYTFGAGLQDFFINTPEGVAQACKTTLQLWLGEFFVDVTAGTPYPEGVLGKNSKDTADSTIQQMILNVTVIDANTLSPVQAVTSIDNYSSELNPVNRQYSSVTAILNTIYGPTELQMQNYKFF